MPQPAPPSAPDWYIQEWMVRKHKKQADIVRDLDWERARASKVVNGKQAYTREDIHQLSRWLEIEPYELFLSPERADQIKTIEQYAVSLAAKIQGYSVIEPAGAPGAEGAPRTAQPEPLKVARGHR